MLEGLTEWLNRLHHAAMIQQAKFRMQRRVAASTEFSLCSRDDCELCIKIRATIVSMKLKGLWED